MVFVIEVKYILMEPILMIFLHQHFIAVLNRIRLTYFTSCALESVDFEWIFSLILKKVVAEFFIEQTKSILIVDTIAQ